ncbi:PEP-CTERM sorting domain-containing protein [Aeoliella sp. ICT_H6.2]|uniref:PEP-CTERM sorting domain-containing protein n=1 Tax=Aeoliella straminimaris TaxID=2954799 RepID=A0A9X2FDA2_9BACT|nr:LamG-like jellyroll fold domain-containing protein [Aeoliella straminimaris]MCO6044194.1 PEP-CTERM sorting domain-containing protein [Aeoliella straminimaris]
MDFNAANWSGNASFTEGAWSGDSWFDAVNNVEASPGGTGGNSMNGGAPIKKVGAIGSNPAASYIEFSEESFDVNEANHPLAGLSEFSISLVFRLPSPLDAIDRNKDTFWEHHGFVGKEIGGPAVGDWNLGITDLNGDGHSDFVGASGVGDADVGTAGPEVDDGLWHTATFVVDDIGGGQFEQRLYLDGASVGVETINYGGGSSVVAASNFAIGARRDGGFGYLPQGDIARLMFFDTPLDDAEIRGQAATYLGLNVPEPASYLLLGGMGLAIVAMRRRLG